jgi:hypothetical protein
MQFWLRVIGVVINLCGGAVKARQCNRRFDAIRGRGGLRASR